jgi:hypothetical protein
MCSLTFSVSNIERHASVCGLGGDHPSPKPAFPKFATTRNSEANSPKDAKSALSTSNTSRTFFGALKRKPEDIPKERHFIKFNVIRKVVVLDR